MSVVAPSMDPVPGAPKPPGKNRVKIARVVVALGVLAAAGVVGFVAGNASAAPTAAAPAPAPAPSPAPVDAEAPINIAVGDTTEARAIIADALMDPENPAVTGQLTAVELRPLLEQFEADPGAWDDQFLTAKIMMAFKTLQDAHNAELAKQRSLLSSDDGRLLIGEYDEQLVNDAWEAVQHADYSNAVRNGDDKVAIVRGTVGETTGCWVVAEESNSAQDWFRNLDLGKQDIKSIKDYQVRDKSCGCEKRFLWWCRKYRSCATAKTIGEGYDGFVKVYNNMRYAIWNRFNSVCQSSDKIILTGYSRGAALVNALVYALHNDGLVPASRLSLVTFGAPRALDDSASDRVHAKFPQWRMIYENDIVPSIPYDWWGFKHFGDMRCKDCGFSEDRDRPFWAWDVGDHTRYCSYFGDKAC